uniref:Uncharacterized protein n=1 Tax=Octopus bimaculoides TaxID=37653 RepID=A0A0L8HKH6_OCTBM
MSTFHPKMLYQADSTRFYMPMKAKQTDKYSSIFKR